MPPRQECAGHVSRSLRTSWRELGGCCAHAVKDLKDGGRAAWLRPLDACVRTTDSLVAAEVSHGLVQARSADAHEGQADDLMVNPAHGGALRC